MPTNPALSRAIHLVTGTKAVSFDEYTVRRRFWSRVFHADCLSANDLRPLQPRAERIMMAVNGAGDIIRTDADIKFQLRLLDEPTCYDVLWLDEGASEADVEASAHFWSKLLSPGRKGLTLYDFATAQLRRIGEAYYEARQAALDAASAAAAATYAAPTAAGPAPSTTVSDAFDAYTEGSGLDDSLAWVLDGLLQAEAAGVIRSAELRRGENGWGIVHAERPDGRGPVLHIWAHTPAKVWVYINRPKRPGYGGSQYVVARDAKNLVDALSRYLG